MSVHISIQRVFRDFSLFFFACRPECDLVFESNQTPKGGKNNFPFIFPSFFPHFSGIFNKNSLINPCGVSKVINIGSGNSILDYIMHSPSPYTISPPVPAFSPSNRPKKPSDFITRDFSLIFCMQAWIVIYSFWIKHQSGGKKFPPSFSRISRTFFFKKLRVRFMWGV